MITTSLGKLKMHSPNLTQDNLARIRELFPNCVTEVSGENGKVKLAVDFDLLRQELSESIVEGPQERYRLDWPGKREALLTANAPIAKTLRPCRDESVDFDITKNLYIEGDNLDALKLLQETYLGKVKMIYIDPPYNTGNDFIYEDDFAENSNEFLHRSNQKDEEGNRLVANTESNGRFHSDWLSMMYPRLKLARNLLRDDGVLFISIADHEIYNLRKICEEIFGDKNFIANIIWEKVHTRKNSAKTFSISHDYILVMAKEKDKWDRILIPRDDTSAYSNPDNDPQGPWKADPITAHNFYSADYKIEKPNGVILKRPQDRYWAYSWETWQEKIKSNAVIWGSDESYPMIKRYLSEVQDGLVPTTLFERTFAGDSSQAKKELTEILGLAALFDYPKPTRLIERLAQISTRPHDIILDFFSGSATTAHAIMKRNGEDGGNRQFIMVQLPEACDEDSEAFKSGYATIAEIGKERIRRAGAKIKAELTEQHSQNVQGSLLDTNAQRSTPLDIGFRVLKIDSSSMSDVYYTPDMLNQNMLDMITDNIKPGRTPEDLLFQVLLDWGVDLTLPIRKQTILGKTVFFVDENALVACFDTGLTEELIKELARAKPLRVVFRDNGFSSDAVKINATQIFRQLSPGTEVKAI